MHFLCLTGLGPLATGGGYAADRPYSPGRDWEQILQKTGAGILAFVFLVEIIYVTYLWRRIFLRAFFPGVISGSANIRGLNLRTTVTCAQLSGVFVGIRAGYTLLYTFKPDNDKVNPVTGKFGLKLILLVIVGAGAVIPLLASAWVTRGAEKELANRAVTTQGPVGEKLTRGQEQVQPPYGEALLVSAG